MGHHHVHLQNHNHKNQENIKIAFLLNLTFTIIEILGGLWTNSIAILSDALHDLGDSLSLAVAWYLEKYSQKGPDQKFSFGYARFSLLGALINSLILVGGSVLILINAAARLFKPEAINSKGMLIFAILGIIINGAAALRLKRGNTINEKVAAWHLIEDILGWAAILVLSIVLMFVDAPILDPILSILITAYVLYNVVKNLKQIMNIFLQGVPKDFSIKEIEKEIKEKTGALSVHHTHIWSLEGEKNMLSTHIIVPDESDNKKIIDIKNKVKRLMLEKGIEHVTIEIDFESENCEEIKCN